MTHVTDEDWQAAAFPHPSGAQGFEGLTKREWFAGQALPSVMHLCAKDTLAPGETIEQAFARKSLDIADALLAALSKGPTDDPR